MSAGAPGRNGNASMTLAERMLDRYGVGYICAHPEILFDGGYLLPPAGAWRNQSNLADRLNEAYAILREVYAPHASSAFHRSARHYACMRPARPASYQSRASGRRYS